MKTHPFLPCIALSLLFLLSGACTNKSKKEAKLDLTTVRDSTDIEYSITGLQGPEAVRYDPDQDVYFISNFNGGGNERDSNGFITKVNARTREVENLEFMTGTDDHPLHAPRGMYITGDSLWVADVDGLHAFDQNTGEHAGFVDFTKFEPGFLNDISADSTGTLYITDTGKATVYQLKNGRPSVFLDSLDVNPNGIVYDPVTKYFILAPWGGKTTLYAFRNNRKTEIFGKMNGGFFDGLEFVGLNLVVTSQQDSTLRTFDGASDWITIHTPGRPADIGFDTHRNLVAVPYIALNRVDFWSLNKKGY